MTTKTHVLGIGLLALLTVLTATPAAVAGEPSRLTSTPTAGGTELAVDGRAAFRTAPGEVRNARLVELDGSPRFVVTWDERTDEEPVRPWYAVSLDGESMAVVKPTSYDVLMRRARFDPRDGAPAFEESAFPDSKDVYIVQFVTQPLEEYLEGVGDAGAVLHAFVSNHAYLARMPLETCDRVRALPYVRWVGPYHPEYRVEPYVLAGVEAGSLPASARYNVQLLEKGLAPKQRVAAAIEERGGTVDPLFADALVLVAAMSPEALVQVAAMDEVLFLDRASLPESDLNRARAFSGANYLWTATGFQGAGVHGEVMDDGLFNHGDFQRNGGPTLRSNSSDNNHGTPVTGIVFGDGTGNSSWRGILPAGTIVFSSHENLTNANRKAVTAPLVDPQQPYQCVFQTNSWGGGQVLIYNTTSAIMDDLTFELDLLILNSQSNTNSQKSRPEAWAKNVLAVGGINHQDTLTRSDDYWQGASYGPAEDGRNKPDLAHFYDDVTTAANTGVASYSGFSGTSCATPITAGYAGLFFEMWHENVFGNEPTGATVFASRPHAATAKAALIATATQWPFSPVYVNRSRDKQGYGAVDIQKMYDLRDRTVFVDQTEVLDNLETHAFEITVAPGEPQLKCCLIWPERNGTPSSSQHRLNDLDLKVTAPDGTTVYWGAGGLDTEMFSAPGVGPSTIETVEPVFVDAPTPGTWTIEIVGAEIVDDLVAGEPGLNAVYSLWIAGATRTASAPETYCTAGTSASGCNASISATGTASATAASGFALTAADVEGDKTGIFYFGTNGRQASPWGSGTSFQCVVPPTVRAGLVTGSGTTAACDGTFLQDLNALWCPVCPKPAKNPGAGAVVQAQLWYRDPLNTSNQTTSLSNAVEFAVQP